MIRSSIPSIRHWPHIAALLSAVVLSGFAPASSQASSFAPAGVTVDGDIASDTTWTSANSPYIVTAPISIASTATLTVEAGVEVRFAANTGLNVAGGLNAQGTHARQVRFISDSATAWQGIVVVQPTHDVLLQSATISNAAAGLTIRQSSLIAGPAPARVDLLDSLLEQNGIGVDADYSILTNAPRLTMRNNLITNNGIGLRVNGLPSGNAKPKFNHNSFVSNGIGMIALNLVGQPIKVQQQWWGNATGPQLGSASVCGSLPPPGTLAADLVCGNVDAVPWSKLPAGRAQLQAGQGAVLESALGTAALSNNDVAATSVMTLTVPAGTFTQTVDLLATARDFATTPPGTPTRLEFEITAAANGQEIHRFANNQQLTLEIAYTSADLANADPSKLVVYTYDETLNAWVFAGASVTVDSANQRLIVRLPHLSRFSVTSVGLQHIMLPLVQR